MLWMLLLLLLLWLLIVYSQRWFGLDYIVCSCICKVQIQDQFHTKILNLKNADNFDFMSVNYNSYWERSQSFMQNTFDLKSSAANTWQIKTWHILNFKHYLQFPIATEWIRFFVLTYFRLFDDQTETLRSNYCKKASLVIQNVVVSCIIFWSLISIKGAMQYLGKKPLILPQTRRILFWRRYFCFRSNLLCEFFQRLISKTTNTLNRCLIQNFFFKWRS